MRSRAVGPCALATVVVEADLPTIGEAVQVTEFGGSREFWSLGWPPGIYRAVCSWVGDVKADGAEDPRFCLPCTGKSAGVQLWVHMPPGCQAQLRCLLPECHVVRHARRETEFLMSRGNQVEVCHHVWPPGRLVAHQGAGIHGKTPHPVPQGVDRLFLRLPRQGQLLPFPHLDKEGRLLPAIHR